MSKLPVVHPPVPTILIVGAGFSGVAVALNLLRIDAQCRIILLDADATDGRGTAYGKCQSSMLLNVRADGMGLWPNEPGHFYDWLASQQLGYEAQDFVPRALYGNYLSQLLSAACERAGNAVQLVRGEAVAVRSLNGAVEITLSDRTVVSGDALVLATGNMAPLPVGGGALSSEKYFLDPWDPAALKGVETLATLGIVGMGLTAIDMIVHAESVGFQGRYHCISRHGLFPEPHTALPRPSIPFPIARWEGGLRRLISLTKELAQEAPHWQDVIDGIRPHSTEIWSRLSVIEKARFLRHAKTHWEVHRHRVPLAVHNKLRELRSAGRLCCMKGRVRALRQCSSSSALLVSWTPRGADSTEQFVVERLLNCSGPQNGFQTHPLLRSATSQGLLCSDELGLGARTDGMGRSKSAPAPLWLIGPLRRADRWESSAVRELRVQAAEIADDICRWLVSAVAA